MTVCKEVVSIGGGSTPRMTAIRRPMASRPCRSRSMATVDSEGVPKRASSSSSQPNTLRSSGHLPPAAQARAYGAHRQHVVRGHDRGDFGVRWQAHHRLVAGLPRPVAVDHLSPEVESGDRVDEGLASVPGGGEGLGAGEMEKAAVAETAQVLHDLTARGAVGQRAETVQLVVVVGDGRPPAPRTRPSAAPRGTPAPRMPSNSPESASSWARAARSAAPPSDRPGPRCTRPRVRRRDAAPSRRRGSNLVAVGSRMAIRPVRRVRMERASPVRAVVQLVDGGLDLGDGGRLQPAVVPQITRNRLVGDAGPPGDLVDGGALDGHASSGGVLLIR